MYNNDDSENSSTENNITSENKPSKLQDKNNTPVAKPRNIDNNNTLKTNDHSTNSSPSTSAREKRGIVVISYFIIGRCYAYHKKKSCAQCTIFFKNKMTITYLIVNVCNKLYNATNSVQ